VAAAPASEMGSSLSGRPLRGKLTQRETELLPLLAEGLSNNEIATKLYIAPETVNTHLQSIYRKLNTRGRIGAVIAARELDLIPRE